ncbi:hypothetical protein NJB1907f44_22810 [Mycobacterium marinum]|uniref:PPE family protein n=1 Tax=Mycobacterium marinum TaxID=1781 RepID=UPI0021C38F46
MNFSVLPPEINSALIFAGAGSEPMLTAAVAWDGLADELSMAASSFESITSGILSGSWQGAASLAMAGAAAPYAGWLATAAGQAAQAGAQASAMAAEFEAVRTAMVPPALVAANRSNLVSLVLSNLFGQNAPAIATVEAAYEEIWALDVSVMSAYHSGASAVVTALTPFAPLQSLAGLQSGLSTAMSGGASGAAAAPAVPGFRRC